MKFSFGKTQRQADEERKASKGEGKGKTNDETQTVGQNLLTTGTAYVKRTFPEAGRIGVDPGPSSGDLLVSWDSSLLPWGVGWRRSTLKMTNETNTLLRTRSADGGLLHSVVVVRRIHAERLQQYSAAYNLLTDTERETIDDAMDAMIQGTAGRTSEGAPPLDLGNIPWEQLTACDAEGKANRAMTEADMKKLLSDMKDQEEMKENPEKFRKQKGLKYLMKLTGTEEENSEEEEEKREENPRVLRLLEKFGSEEKVVEYGTPKEICIFYSITDKQEKKEVKGTCRLRDLNRRFGSVRVMFLR